MDWNIAEGNWKQFKGKVKAQWGNLTDNHLDVIAGKRIELAGKIQEVYGITIDETEQQIQRFEERAKVYRPKRPFRRDHAVSGVAPRTAPGSPRQALS
jgi:uncharacterized protein YjbJ (UPF0337 family)